MWPRVLHTQFHTALALTAEGSAVEKASSIETVNLYQFLDVPPRPSKTWRSGMIPNTTCTARIWFRDPYYVSSHVFSYEKLMVSVIDPMPVSYLFMQDVVTNPLTFKTILNVIITLQAVTYYLPKKSISLI